MEFKNTPNKSYQIDGKEIWVSRSVAINVIIMIKHNDDNYILIGKRGRGTPDYVGKWNIPSGYLDWDENGKEACYREVWEECGLDLKKLIDDNYHPFNINDMDNPWYVQTDPSSDKQNVSLRYGYIFQRDFEELPKLTSVHSEENEVEDLEWFKINSLDDLNKKEWAFNHKELIKQYLNKIDFFGIFNNF